MEKFDGAIWRKSGGSSDGNCVEVAMKAPLVGVRDTKARTSGTLAFGLDDWRNLLAGLRAGEFDK